MGWWRSGGGRGGWCSQGLVALAGLRTLGFGKGRPYRGLRGCRGLCGGWACAAVGVPRVRSPARATKPWGLSTAAGQAPAGRSFSKPRVRSPERATKPWGLLTAARAPAGRSFSKPRVRSPAGATKPWVRSYPQSRSPAGATHSAALSFRVVLLSRVVRGEVLCPDS